jgi:hypothetical protein|eukprot:COSAG02_NODE_19537_length_877_cov_1.172237_1_plen_75_part_00
MGLGVPEEGDKQFQANKDGHRAKEAKSVGVRQAAGGPADPPSALTGRGSRMKIDYHVSHRIHKTAESKMPVLTR